MTSTGLIQQKSRAAWWKGHLLEDVSKVCA